jgi:hypothetical protein
MFCHPQIPRRPAQVQSCYATDARHAERRCADFYGGVWRSTEEYGLSIRDAGGEAVGLYFSVERWG